MDESENLIYRIDAPADIKTGVTVQDGITGAAEASGTEGTQDGRASAEADTVDTVAPSAETILPQERKTVNENTRGETNDGAGDVSDRSGGRDAGARRRTVDGDIPVKMTVKFYDYGSPKLHVIVNGGTPVQEAWTHNAHSATEGTSAQITIPEYFRLVNGCGEFMKRVPDSVTGRGTINATQDSTEVARYCGSEGKERTSWAVPGFNRNVNSPHMNDYPKGT